MTLPHGHTQQILAADAIGQAVQICYPRASIRGQGFHCGAGKQGTWYQFGVFGPSADIFEEVAHPVGTLGDECEALTDHGLLALDGLPATENADGVSDMILLEREDRRTTDTDSDTLDDAGIRRPTSRSYSTTTARTSASMHSRLQAARA